jgi:hypothetical protein
MGRRGQWHNVYNVDSMWLRSVRTTQHSDASIEFDPLEMVLPYRVLHAKIPYMHDKGNE